MEIKDRVALIRKNSGMSLRAFADVIGVSFGVIINIEHEKAPMTRVVGIAICSKFNVSEEWLFEGTGPMYQEDNLVDALATRHHMNDLQRSILYAAASLTPEEAQLLCDIAKRVQDGQSIPDALPTLTAADLPPYIPQDSQNEKKSG